MFVQNNYTTFLWLLNNTEFPHKEKIFLQIDAFCSTCVVVQNDQWYVAVSWWPDSIVLLYVLCAYIVDTTDVTSFLDIPLTVLTYDHAQRHDSAYEIACVYELCRKLWLSCVSATYIWDWHTERALRDARYDFFSSAYKRSVLWRSFLFLWHHLDDRIETSFLHMMRWSWVDWFLNMWLVSNYNNVSLSNDAYRVRPLLSSSKKELLEIGDSNWLYYFLDASNTDVSVSQRNAIRWILQKTVSWGSQDADASGSMYGYSRLQDSFLWLYESLEVMRKNVLPVVYTDLRCFGDDIAHTVHFSDIVCPYQFCCVLRYLWVWKNLSSSMIYEFTNFLQWVSWSKYIWWRNIYRSNGKNYVLKYVWHMSTNCIRVLNNELYTVPSRPYTPKDKIHGKSVSKKLLNDKIPVFLRKRIYVVDLSTAWWDIYVCRRTDLEKAWFLENSS